MLQLIGKEPRRKVRLEENESARTASRHFFLGKTCSAKFRPKKSSNDNWENENQVLPKSYDGGVVYAHTPPLILFDTLMQIMLITHILGTCWYVTGLANFHLQALVNAHF